MSQKALPFSLLGDEQSLTPDHGLDTLGNFNRLAAVHVRVMLNSLIADHHSIVQSLQSEITSLRQKHSEPDEVPASPKASPASGLLPDDVDVELTSSGSDCAGSANTSATTKKKRGKSNNGELYLKKLPGEFESSKKDVPSKHATGLTRKNSTLSDTGGLIRRPSPRNTKDAGCFAAPSPVKYFVFSNRFEMITGFVIVANTMMMAMQQQYKGFDMGYAIRPEDYSKPADETWPGGEIAFSVAGTLFNVLFCTELALRFYANGLPCIWMPWMWFDTVVVLLGCLDSMFSGGGLGIDPSMIRLVRLVRLVRLLKIFKSMSQFDSLFLLVKAINASVGALIWSLLLLSAVMTGAALFLGQILSGELMDTQKDMKVRDQLFVYFGTFSRTMMTMVEITLGNWVPSCRLLMESVHESFFVFFLVYRCMFCFSVLRVINAVFISETNRVLASDVDLAVMKGERDHAGFKRQLLRVLTNMDTDGSGTVSFEEVKEFMGDPEISRLLFTIGFSRENVEKVFWLVAEDGHAHIDKLVHTMLALRGDAKPVDIHIINQKVQEILRWLQACEQYSSINNVIGSVRKPQRLLKL